MNEESKRKDDHLESQQREQQWIEQLESEPDYEELLRSETEYHKKRLYANFQNAAVNISQLYKDKHYNHTSHWIVFQNAAGAVTCLYKDGVEIQKKINELGIHTGYQRRNRDLLAWVKKKRRNIRKEDLIAFLAAKAMYNPRSSPRPRNSSIDSQLRSASIQRFGEVESEMSTFKDALAVSNLSGAMSGISVSSNRPNSSSTSGRHHRHSGGNGSPGGASCSLGSKSQDLQSFITQQCTQNMKRPNNDAFNEAPQSKRSRFA